MRTDQACPRCGGPKFREIKNEILSVGCHTCEISYSNHVRFGCVADGDWEEFIADDQEVVSECCGQPLYEDTDICTGCKEHN
jgi:hypothetical protein